MNSQERTSSLSCESMFHSVINAMLMFKEAASLAENEMRKKLASCIVSPKYAKCLHTGFTSSWLIIVCKCV